MNAVNAINAVRGPVWLVLLTLAILVLIYARYRKLQPTGNLVDSLNSIHPAVYGFVLCIWGIVLALNAHEQFGDKVFLSGASFIGGVMARQIQQNGNGNGNGTTNGVGYRNAGLTSAPPPTTGGTPTA